MKTVLLTGGTGFVGANLTRFLLALGCKVHLIVRSGFSNWRIREIQPHLYVHIVELTNFSKLVETINHIRPDWIFHLATHGAYSYQTDTQQIVQTNMLGTINLVEACSKYGFEAFINTGSSSEYGFKDHAAKEDEFADPNSCYAVTKLSATLFCRYIANQRKLHISTLRLYSVFGAYEEPTRLFPTLVKHGLRNEFPPLVDPAIARDFVYIDDVINAYHLAVTQPTREYGAIYNVGTGIQTSLGQVVEIAQRLMHIQTQPQWQSMPNRHWDTTSWVADPTKIKRELGWEPQYDVEQGMKKYIDWVKHEN